MIQFVRGNLFESKAEALVNTVNCVGVMGKGIAYQFKRAYPLMFREYSAKCKRGEIKLGEVTAYRENGRLIINFPTKGHWRAKSRLEDVRRGLDALKDFLQENDVPSVALPPLGCGNGGLDWPDVKGSIQKALGGLEEIRVEVYEPIGNFRSQVAAKPRVSLGHFVLAGLGGGLGHRGKLDLQKAAYFFNEFAGQEYYKFTDYRYGPYSVAIEALSRAIRDYMEYRQLSSPSEMVRAGVQSELRGAAAAQLEKWLPTIGAVTSFCNRHAKGLEALATAHAVVARRAGVSEAEVVDGFLSWSKEKSTRFNEADVKNALKILEAEGLIHRTLFGFEGSRPLGQGTRSVTIDLPEGLARRLEEVADQRGVEMSAVVCEILQQHFVRE